MDNIFFVDHQFLQLNLLTPENILDYFSTSPFYDKSSNNEILKMQNQYRGLNTNYTKISKLKGMFYLLDYNNPENTLFIIRQGINDTKTTNSICFYYVIHGFIYKAPTNYKIYNSRVNNIYWYLNEILDVYFYKMFTVEKNEKRDEKNEIDDVLRDVMIKFEKDNE